MNRPADAVFTMPLLLLLATIVSLASPAGLASPATAEEKDGGGWTRFHGPNGTGISENDTLPAKWTPADYNWRIKLPGMGHSSPVVYKNRIFLLGADPRSATRFVICVDAQAGRIAWLKEFESESHHLHNRSSFASSTPAVDAQRVYVAWSKPSETTLMALDHDGKILWRKNLGRWVSQHGFGTSPILYGSSVILSNSQQGERLKPGDKPGESFVMALERSTGKEQWRTPIPSSSTSYSVPCIYRSQDGEPQLIGCCSKGGMYSLNPLTGKKNWSIEAFDKRTVSSPVIVGDVILGSTGSGGGGNYLVGVRPGVKPALAFKIDRQAPYVPTSVAKGHLAFLFSDKGFASCIDTQSGKVHFRQRMRLGNNAGFSGSPVRAGNKIFVVDESGVVHVIAAATEYRLLGRNPLGEESRSTPAISGGRIYFRTYSHLVSIGAESL